MCGRFPQFKLVFFSGNGHIAHRILPAHGNTCLTKTAYKLWCANSVTFGTRLVLTLITEHSGIVRHVTTFLSQPYIQRVFFIENALLMIKFMFQWNLEFYKDYIAKTLKIFIFIFSLPSSSLLWSYLLFYSSGLHYWSRAEGSF